MSDFFIEDDAHVHEAVSQLDDGHAIIFNGGGVYAFGSATISGIDEISKVKRLLKDRPPVTIALWETIKDIIDWDQLQLGNTLTETQEYFKQLHNTLPAVIIYPVIEHKAKQLISSVLNQDWADRIVWGSGKNSTLAIDTVAYPGVFKLLRFAAYKNIKILFLTSANKPGEPTIAYPEDVVRIFPEISFVMKDTFMDSFVKQDAQQVFSWTSYTSINMREFISGKIHFERIGSMSHQTYREFHTRHSHLKGPVRIIRSKAKRVLTDKPAFRTYHATIKLFQAISQKINR